MRNSFSLLARTALTLALASVALATEPAPEAAPVEAAVVPDGATIEAAPRAGEAPPASAASPAPTGPPVSITIVLSGPQAPYRELATDLTRRIADEGRVIRTVSLGTFEKDEDEPTTETGERTLFVAVGTSAAEWLGKHADDSIPIVYAMVTGIESTGLAERPRTAGVRGEVSLRAQLELVSEALPAARTVGMLFRASDPDSKRLRDQLSAALQEGWALQAVDVGEHASASDAIDALLATRPDVVWTGIDRPLIRDRTISWLLLHALRAKVPVFGYAPPCVERGALLGIGISPSRQARQAAALVQEMLAVPADSPRPARHEDPDFALWINTDAARKLGIDLPPELVARAAHVYSG